MALLGNNTNSSSLMSSLSLGRPSNNVSSTPGMTGGFIQTRRPSTQQQQLSPRQIQQLNQTVPNNNPNSSLTSANFQQQMNNINNQFNDSVNRQIASLDSVATRMTQAISQQTTTLVSSLKGIKDEIGLGFRNTLETLNKLFSERVAAYNRDQEIQLQNDEFKDYTTKFFSNFIENKLMDLVRDITTTQLKSLKEFKETTLQYFMQNESFARFIGLNAPYGSQKNEYQSVPFTKDIADSIITSSNTLYQIYEELSVANQYTAHMIDAKGPLIEMNKYLFQIVESSEKIESNTYLTTTLLEEIFKQNEKVSSEEDIVKYSKENIKIDIGEVLGNPDKFYNRMKKNKPITIGNKTLKTTNEDYEIIKKVVDELLHTKDVNTLFKKLKKEAKYSTNNKQKANESKNSILNDTISRWTDSINQHRLSLVKNTEAVEKQITALDVLKTSALAVVNPMNWKKLIWSFGKWFGKFYIPYRMLMWKGGLIKSGANFLGGIGLPEWMQPKDKDGKVAATTVGGAVSNIYSRAKIFIKDLADPIIVGFKNVLHEWLSPEWFNRIEKVWTWTKNYTSDIYTTLFGSDLIERENARKRLFEPIRHITSWVTEKILIPGIIKGIGIYTVGKNLLHPIQFMKNFDTGVLGGYFHRKAYAASENIRNYRDQKLANRVFENTYDRMQYQYGAENNINLDKVRSDIGFQKFAAKKFMEQGVSKNYATEMARTGAPVTPSKVGALQNSFRIFGKFTSWLGKATYYIGGFIAMLQIGQKVWSWISEGWDWARVKKGGFSSVVSSMVFRGLNMIVDSALEGLKFLKNFGWEILVGLKDGVGKVVDKLMDKARDSIEVSSAYKQANSGITSSTMDAIVNEFAPQREASTDKFILKQYESELIKIKDENLQKQVRDSLMGLATAIRNNNSDTYIENNFITNEDGNKVISKDNITQEVFKILKQGIWNDQDFNDQDIESFKRLLSRTVLGNGQRALNDAHDELVSAMNKQYFGNSMAAYASFTKNEFEKFFNKDKVFTTEKEKLQNMDEFRTYIWEKYEELEKIQSGLGKGALELHKRLSENITTGAKYDEFVSKQVPIMLKMIEDKHFLQLGAIKSAEEMDKEFLSALQQFNKGKFKEALKEKDAATRQLKLYKLFDEMYKEAKNKKDDKDKNKEEPKFENPMNQPPPSDGVTASLGTLTQWIQSGSAKKWFGEQFNKLGEHIKGAWMFLKNQDYKKMFGDAMATFGGITGNIMSALFGEDTATKWLNEAYKYADKKGFATAKRFLAGARSSVLSNVKDIAGLASKLNTNVEAILEQLKKDKEESGLDFKNNPTSNISVLNGTINGNVANGITSHGSMAASVRAGGEVDNRVVYGRHLMPALANPVYTSRYGMRQLENESAPRLHKGIDLAGAGVENTQVFPAWKGEVFSFGEENGYGKTVVLKHTMSDGKVYYTRYAHLNEIGKAIMNGRGTVVYPYNPSTNTGTVIGLAGKTGGNYSPHLHFGVGTTAATDNEDPVTILEKYRNENSYIFDSFNPDTSDLTKNISIALDKGEGRFKLGANTNKDYVYGLQFDKMKNYVKNSGKYGMRDEFKAALEKAVNSQDPKKALTELVKNSDGTYNTTYKDDFKNLATQVMIKDFGKHGKFNFEDLTFPSSYFLTDHNYHDWQSTNQIIKYASGKSDAKQGFEFLKAQSKIDPYGTGALILNARYKYWNEDYPKENRYNKDWYNGFKNRIINISKPLGYVMDSPGNFIYTLGAYSTSKLPAETTANLGLTEPKPKDLTPEQIQVKRKEEQFNSLKLYAGILKGENNAVAHAFGGTAEIEKILKNTTEGKAFSTRWLPVLKDKTAEQIQEALLHPELNGNKDVVDAIHALGDLLKTNTDKLTESGKNFVFNVITDASTKSSSHSTVGIGGNASDKKSNGREAKLVSTGSSNKMR